MLPISSAWRASCFRRDCKPATRSAEGPMSTPRRLAPRSIGTPMMRIFSAMRFLSFRGPGLAKGLSRIDAIEHAREGDDFANVLGSANPCDGALQAQAEAGMGHAAVSAQVQVPLKRLFGQAGFADAAQERLVTRLALAATDDFA